MIVHFAGLGSMGSGMAAALIRAGHEVYGRDPHAPSVEALVAAGMGSASIRRPGTPPSAWS